MIMDMPVKLDLYDKNRLIEEFVAHDEDDLRCRIEMLTGIAWLDAADLYLDLLRKGKGELSRTYKVCNSYEKWGEMQQEVMNIKVKMARL